jgi:CheY-like chemotaxis protein
MSADVRRDLAPWFRLFTRLQGEQHEADLLSTLALELASITGAEQITLHRSRPGEGTQVQAVLGEPAKLTDTVPEELGQTVTEDRRVCTMVYNGWRETIWLVLVVDEPASVAEVLPEIAPQLGELLYNIRAAEAARAESLEHLQHMHEFKARVASLLQKRGQHMEVAPSREDALWEAVGSLHQLAQLPLTLIIEDDGTTARALASDRTATASRCRFATSSCW